MCPRVHAEDPIELGKAHVPTYATWLQEYVPGWTLNTVRPIVLEEPGTQQRAEASRSEIELPVGVAVGGSLTVW